MVDVRDLTMCYRSGRGVFGLSFTIKEGELFGYLGPNGAGKTTTIRLLLGFMRPDRGACLINGMNCWSRAADIQRQLGYMPGETAFLSGMKANEFLRLLSDMRAARDAVRRKNLTERFEIDTNIPLRKMSKGTKQKVAIIAAFMHDPAVYILDEPTNGLDPLMQKRFIELVLEEKRRGKTILMSSHMFEEIERTCDRAGIVRNGRLAAIEDITALKQMRQRKYTLTLESAGDAQVLKRAGLNIVDLGQNRLEVTLTGKMNTFLRELSSVSVESLETGALNLEEVFMQYYGEEA